MKCRKCGEENFNEGSHCAKCGARLRVISKILIALVSAGIGVLLLAILVVFYIVPAIQYPYQRSEECVRTGSYVEAEQLYQEHFVNNDDQTMKLLGLAQDRIIAIEEDFKTSKLNFDSAVAELSSMQVLSIAKDPVLAAKKKLCSNYLERVKTSYTASPLEYSAAMAEVSKMEPLGMLTAETVSQARTAISQDYLMAIQTGFEKRMLDYETALEMLGDVTSKEVDQQKGNVSIRLKELKASRDAFLMAKDYFNKNKLKDGLTKLKMVINSDDQYVEAQSLYHEKLNELKKQVLSEATGFAKQKNYETCVIVLSSLLTTYFDNKDKELSEAIAKYTKLNNAMMKAEAKKNQQVIFVSARTLHGAFEMDYIQIVVKNQTKNTIKYFKVEWYEYDKNGKFIGQGSGGCDIRIGPGRTFGRGYGWWANIDGIKTIIACVTRVEYTDGTIWDNPYYDYWYQDYYNKPLR